MIMYRALTELSNPPLSMEPLIAGMLTLCKEFRQVKFSHVCWQRNKPTHLLAKHAQSIVDFTAWIEENPSLLSRLLFMMCFLSRNFNKVVAFHIKRKKKLSLFIVDVGKCDYFVLLSLYNIFIFMKLSLFICHCFYKNSLN